MQLKFSSYCYTVVFIVHSVSQRQKTGGYIGPSNIVEKKSKSSLCFFTYSTPAASLCDKLTVGLIGFYGDVTESNMVSRYDTESKNDKSNTALPLLVLNHVYIWC